MPQQHEQIVEIMKDLYKTLKRYEHYNRNIILNALQAFNVNIIASLYENNLQGYDECCEGTLKCFEENMKMLREKYFTQ